MASFWKVIDQNGISFCSIILTALPVESENSDDLWKAENYPVHMGAVDIFPAFGQFEMVKEGEVIGTVNSSELDISPEEKEEYGGYNLIINSMQLQEFGIEEPFADEFTLKDKIEFIVGLAKKTQSELAKED